jgi:hypothetical protein
MSERDRERGGPVLHIRQSFFASQTNPEANKLVFFMEIIAVFS